MEVDNSPTARPSSGVSRRCLTRSIACSALRHSTKHELEVLPVKTSMGICIACGTSSRLGRTSSGQHIHLSTSLHVTLQGMLSMRRIACGLIRSCGKSGMYLSTNKSDRLSPSATASRCEQRNVNPEIEFSLSANLPGFRLDPFWSYHSSDCAFVSSIHGLLLLHHVHNLLVDEKIPDTCAT